MAVDPVVVTATVEVIPAFMPQLGRNSKNRDFLLTAFVRLAHAWLYLRGSWNFLPANPASSFMHGRGKSPQVISTWTYVHRLHLNNLRSYPCLYFIRHF
ncbi:hypothetical protein AZE42_01335, partial [Rhizopogon vesiculosus]